MFFMPAALEVNAHLHIFWNSYQKACTSLGEWGLFEKLLRAFCNFAGDKERRDLFVTKCMRDAPTAHIQSLAHFSGRHLSWRWEHLEQVSQQVLDLLPIV